MADEALQSYFKDLQDEVKSAASQFGTAPEAARRESAFTAIAARMMAETGLVDMMPEICRYEERFGPAVLRVMAGAASEDHERLDLFISLYEPVERIEQVQPERVMNAAGAALIFLKHCADGSLARRLRPSDPALALITLVSSAWKTLDQIRLWVLTNGVIPQGRFKSQEIGGKLVGLEVMDLQRLSRLALMGERGEDVDVDFVKKCGEPLPCVFYSDERAPYDTALCLFPGEFLRSLYESYDARLIEANVRSYLSLQSKVNRGIYATLKDRPEDFLAFNNGIVAVADELQIARASSGTTGVKAIKGMRIVNGGQTTATLFFSRRRTRDLDLSRVRIPAKILVLKRPAPEENESFLADISRYANTQNNVRPSDLYSSSPFHVGLERIARTTWCPDGQAQWFYERMTGAYRTMIAREKTPAARRRLKSAIPPSRCITKLDLAKYMNAWLGHPDIACQSAQKCFGLFMKELEAQTGPGAARPTENTWKDIVSVAILYRTSHQMALKLFPENAASLATYSVAIAGRLLGPDFHLRMVWESQRLSGPLAAQIERWQREINGILRLSSLGKPVSEWAREAECWKFVLESIEGEADPSIPEIQPAGASGRLAAERR